VASNEWPYPTTKTSGIDLGGYRYVTAYFDVGGTSPSWTVIPLAWNGTAYFAMTSDAVTVTTDQSIVYDMIGENNVYFYLYINSGTAPTMTVKTRVSR
jgi:hypothetical protein